MSVAGVSALNKLSEKKLKDWAGWKAFRDGQSLFERGVVEKIQVDDPFITGQLNLGPRGMRSRFEVLSNGLVENHCPCRDNQERGLICSHLVAMGLKWLEDQQVEAAVASGDPSRLEQIERSAKGVRIRRARKSTPGAMLASLRLVLGKEWKKELDQFALRFEVMLNEQGILHPIHSIQPDQAVYLQRSDDQLLQVIEGFSGGSIKADMRVSMAQWVEILNRCSKESLQVEGGKEKLKVSKRVVEPELMMDLDRETGELLLEIAWPDETLVDPRFMLGDKEAWMVSEHEFRPLSHRMPDSLRAIYTAPLRILREQVPSFLMSELVQLEKEIQVNKRITADLFYMKPAKPSFRLHVKGSPASLAARLFAIYEVGDELIAGRADRRGNFAIPDERDLLKYRIRNMAAEKQAVELLAQVGFEGRAGDTLRNIEGVEEVLNFLGSGVPQIQRLGWQVTLEGRVRPFMEKAETVRPTIQIQESNDGSYFDLNYSYETEASSISENEIRTALQAGNSFVKKAGKTVLLDGDAIMQALEVFEDCAAKERSKGHRVEAIHGSYVYATLGSLEGVDLEANEAWLDRAKRLHAQETVEEVVPSPMLNGTLRSYQQEGLNWLRFLEQRGFCGILADEMGLGKTLQTLAWLQLKRCDEAHADLPALIICPTSLVENWHEEAARFTPDQKVLVLHGGDRHRLWKKVDSADIVITSYALMRRDIEKHLKRTYSVAILDEAQQIKNRFTQNALAAKRLLAHHRLVLSGTPIENSVTDLWSIMDFLMPGYLGNHKSFHEQYELPIMHGGEEGENAQAKLRRKLHPFLLRRLKKHVAKDLPPKIERIAPCKLTGDQVAVYKQILAEARGRIEEMVEKRGFNQSRMEILKTLLRLRQTCNHIDLLKMETVKAKQPSGKMDLFFSLLQEAIDSRHRILVFSQFTGMLAILKREMEKKKLKYCYLDGGTKDRQDVVRLFNRDHSIPVFLMSLKAGGTGLNLTGADMVIHFDPWWNPAVENQATDRAHRIGQKRTVYSVKLITKGTIEDKVVAMQESKRSVIDATLTTDEQIMQKLTWEDVQQLLAL
ncbi:MAG: hypothetical protein CMF27_06615 [Kiritimatiellaceae bacterium]|jgi:superfamily II DNA or RNA helicase|nr:hypothetical protein [Kiritimatiellaceae bacterium]